MQVVIGKTAGFCFGVRNAVEKTEEQVKSEDEIYCLGELVHNKQVIEKLENKGVKFIKNLTDAKDKVIIRAHGAEKQIYEAAKENNIEIVDLTCPKVIFTHKLAEEYAEKGYYIFLIGKKEHPEIIATKSFCGENYTIIEEIEDIEEAIQNFSETDYNKIFILAQTTYNLDKFNEIVQKVKDKVTNVDIEVKNTICNATKNRQEETIEIAKTVDSMIIIGGRNSSNSVELYETARNFCDNIQFVENAKEVDLQKLKEAKKVGIMAGASTPQESIEEIAKIVKEQ